ncbi:uncharacterized protein [Amphiura filiformis]|uniref:uncharacterized protein n=1 Tax=Amphiura filiformis TaxID=82378 RepID=UPI003B21B466
MATTTTFVRVSVMMVFMGFAPEFCIACLEAQPPPPDVDIGVPDDIPQLTPVFDPNTGNVGVGVGVPVQTQVRKRRETSEIPPSKIALFTMMDMNDNDQLQLEEWIKAAGTSENFVEFLRKDDSNGDAMISWEEFQKVPAITFN